MSGYKRGEIVRFLVILSMIVLTVGIIYVSSAAIGTSPQVSSPAIVKGGTNVTINFTITATNSTIQYVGINIPSSFGGVIDCPALIPGGWACNKHIQTNTTLNYTNSAGLTNGSLEFGANVTAPLTNATNITWTINTTENENTTLGLNTTDVNVTVDSLPPLVYSLNVSDSNFTISEGNLSDGSAWLKAELLTFNVSVSDLNYTNIVNASIYYNVTNTTNETFNTIPNPSIVGTYEASIDLTSKNPAEFRFNGTLAATAFANGTRIHISVVANDSVNNVNFTNLTSYTYNLSIDGVAPSLTEPKINDSFDAAPDNITISTQVHNFTVIADDHGGSGVSRVEIAANTSGGMLVYRNMTRAASTTLYYWTGSMQEFGLPTGDANYTVWYRAFDNVSNLNDSLVSLNVLVDDPDFTAHVTVNDSDSLVAGNFTVVNITIVLNATINRTFKGGSTASSNLTIHGPSDFRYNMTLDPNATLKWGTPGNTTSQFLYQSTWYSSIYPQADFNTYNGTWSNLSDFGCSSRTGDAANCSLQITWMDIFGRQNSTNVTITMDNIGPVVGNISLNSTNGTINVVRSTNILNFTLDAQNFITNVTLHNSTLDGDRSNATVMDPGVGINFSISSSSNALCGNGFEGTCTVNFTSTDNNNNRTQSAGTATFIVDDTAPVVSNIKVAGVAEYKNRTDTGLTGVVRSDVQLNLTFNVTDQVTNVTQVNIGNSTFRNTSNWNDAESYMNVSSLADFGCPTGVEFDCQLVVHAIDNISMDGSVNSNTTTNITLHVDDLTPRVVNLTTNASVKHSLTSTTQVINISVNITDANLALGAPTATNVTIGNLTPIVMNSSGSHSSNSTSVVYFAHTTLTGLGCSADGSCTVRVTANDSAGNANDSVTLVINADSSTISTVGMNISPSTGTQNPISVPIPTLWINLTTNTVCRYSTSIVPFDDMTAMGGDGIKSHSVNVSLRDGTSSYNYRCTDTDSVEPANVFPQSATFTIDTTPLWNITVGATGALSAQADYFTSAAKLYKFTLPKTNVLATTALNTTYNVTDVLASIVGPNNLLGGTTNNLSILWAYNRTGDSWTSYVPGRVSNTLTNFTSDEMDYYINLTVANERIEIN